MNYNELVFCINGMIMGTIPELRHKINIMPIEKENTINFHTELPIEHPLVITFFGGIIMMDEILDDLKKHKVEKLVFTSNVSNMQVYTLDELLELKRLNH